VKQAGTSNIWAHKWNDLINRYTGHMCSVEIQQNIAGQIWGLHL